MAPGRSGGHPRRGRGVSPVVPAGSRARLVLALVVVLLGLLGTLLPLAGPAQLGTPRLAAIGGPVQRLDAQVAEDAVVAEQARPPGGSGLPGWLLVAVWTIALVAVLSAAVRSVRRAGPSVPTPDDPPPPDGDGAPLLRLGGLHDTARSAAADVRGAGPPDVADAVVLAWERLEAAAASLGRPRPVAATPTEFTADLLLRLGAEPAATGRLLGLYHRARFSSAPLPAGAEVVAGAALEAVAASLEPAARRGDA